MSVDDPGGVPVDETVLGIVDFPTVRRGYAPDSVRSFVSAAHAELRRLADDNRRLHARIDALESEAEVAAQALEEAKRAVGDHSPAHGLALPPPPVEVPEPQRAQVADWNEVADALMRGARAESDAIVAAARREAATIIERAEADAASIVDRANDDALALRRDAAEAKEAIAAADSTARAELEQVERQRAAIAASLTALQHALAHAVESMDRRSSGPGPLDPPTS